MNKKLRYMMLCLSLFAFGCNDWLDVQPKSQVKEEDLFSSESGFRDALTGIYALMGRVETYGGNSTMGFMDMLAQTYSKVDYDYEDALKYNYKEEHVKGIVDMMWSSNYNAIANCNYLLQNIEKKGSVMSERLRNVVEGEALALRAFLHFDLLRGYAPSYKMGKDEPAIPYVREVTNSPVVQSTVAEVLEYILTDLKTAQALLKPVDPIGPSFAEYNDKLEYGMDEYITDDGFWLYRKSRLNYYGVTALMARVYLCQENLTDALACAQEVIDSKRFEFMNDSINNVYAYRNLSYIEKMARHEYVSSLYVYDLKEGRSDLFFKNLASCECVIAEGRKASIYSGMGQDLDIRSKNWFETPAGSATEYVNKYMRGTQIPLLKLSEMYLIAAEASGDIRYLETLRANRGYATDPLPAGANLQDEITKEYQKEFIAEGQLFYYYKRRNMAILPITSTSMNRATYVLPVPDNELEFGNFKQN